MTTYFPEVNQIRFEGPDTDNQLAYRFYNPEKIILGKTMAEQGGRGETPWSRARCDAAPRSGCLRSFY